MFRAVQAARATCQDRARCVFAGPSASHFKPGGMYTPAARAQCLSDSLMTKDTSACGDSSDDIRPYSIATSQALQHSPILFFDLLNATSKWQHPGFGMNHHGKGCDCMHFCYKATDWLRLIHGVMRLHDGDATSSGKAEQFDSPPGARGNY